MVDLRRRFHILPCLSLRNLRESFGRLGRWEKKKKGVGMKGEGKVQSCLLLIALVVLCCPLLFHWRYLVMSFSHSYNNLKVQEIYDGERFYPISCQPAKPLPSGCVGQDSFRLSSLSSNGHLHLHPLYAEYFHYDSSDLFYNLVSDKLWCHSTHFSSVVIMSPQLFVYKCHSPFISVNDFKSSGFWHILAIKFWDGLAKGNSHFLVQSIVCILCFDSTVFLLLRWIYFLQILLLRTIAFSKQFTNISSFVWHKCHIWKRLC